VTHDRVIACNKAIPRRLTCGLHRGAVALTHLDEARSTCAFLSSQPSQPVDIRPREYGQSRERAQDGVSLSVCPGRQRLSCNAVGIGIQKGNGLAYDSTGKTLLGHLQGIVKGTRITIDTTVGEIF
jgi:hypothetical protein